MRPLFFSLILTGLLSCAGRQQPATVTGIVSGSSSRDSLEAKLRGIIRDKKATVGIAVIGLEDGDTCSINGDRHFAMMSVAKFPQALTLLHLADEGKYDPGRPLQFGPEDLKQRTGSSILQDHPQVSFSLPLTEALRYSIGQSDNITSNKIFQLEGGPQAVEAYVHSAGIMGIGLRTDYGRRFSDSFRTNWCTPWAMLQLLRKFHRGELLSGSSKSMLWKAMVESSSGPDRIKGLLPTGTIVAHKTGTSGTDEKTGITPAITDVGIVQLADGRHFAIAVFIEDSGELSQVNAGIIAELSKAAWDYFMEKSQR